MNLESPLPSALLLIGLTGMATALTFGLRLNAAPDPVEPVIPAVARQAPVRRLPPNIAAAPAETVAIDGLPASFDCGQAQTWLEGRSESHRGKATAWSTPGDGEREAAAVESTLSAIPHVEVAELDCSEPPCVIAVNSSGIMPDLARHLRDQGWQIGRVVHDDRQWIAAVTRTEWPRDSEQRTQWRVDETRKELFQ